MKEIQKQAVDEIIELHNNIISQLKTSLEKAIRIGELLTGQKTKSKHGEWLPWIANNLPFTDQTARNYMKLYENRDRLKSKSVLNLKEAYNILLPSKESNIQDVDYEEMTNESVCYISDSLMKLAAILEEMKEGDTVTGFTHQGDAKSKPDIVNILKCNDDYARYCYHFFHGEEGITFKYSDQPVLISTMLFYMEKHPNISFENIDWIYPGITYNQKFCNG